MRLFRQPRGASSWNDTIRRLADALRTWVAAPPATRLPLLDNTAVPPSVSLASPFAPPAEEDAYAAALAAYQAGRHDEAEGILRGMLAGDPADAGCWNNLGNLLQETGRLDEAESAFGTAISLVPEQPSFHSNLGNLLVLGERLADAEAAYRRAIELDPGNAVAHNQLGSLLNKDGRPEEAAAAYRQALELAPDYADAHNNLGIVFKNAGNGTEAEAAYRLALQLNTGFAEAHNNLGILLLDDERFPEAETALRRALELKPDFPDVYSNLGNLLKQTHRLDEAEACYRRALELKPDDATAHNNLGVLLHEADQLNAAEAAYRHALELNPKFADARSNLGILLQRLRRYQEAEAAYRGAIELNPDCTDAKLNLGLMLLALGRYAEAWPWHEARHFPDNKARRTMQPPFDFPQWRGEPLAGKSLVVVLEQGAGDNVQFVRYAPLLKARGLARLSFVEPATLVTLLATARGVDAMVADVSTMPPHDFWCFPLSLPLHLGTTLDTIPDTLPYLWALPERVEKWRARLPATGPGGDIRVGLVWKGNPDHKNDANRSLSHLSVLAPLWQVPGISFVSLQKGQGEDEARQPPPGQPLLHLGDDIADFADTAAIVAQLDLVITVDSAAAHVAGALGKPVWVLLPGFGTDWRWLLEREDSPWYPGVMRLFRQPRGASSWNDTIRRLADALRAWVAAPPATRLPLLDHPLAEISLPPALSPAADAPPEETEAGLRQAIARDPGDFRLQVDFARFLKAAGRLDEAAAAFRAALDIEPDHLPTLALLAQVCKEARRLDAAEATYRRMIELDPRDIVTHNNLGNVLLEGKRVVAAEASFRRALDLDPHSEYTHSNLGNSLKAQNRLVEAEAAYRRALDLKPDSTGARLNLGFLLLALGRYAEAWPYHEDRFFRSRADRQAPDIGLSYPQWHGEPLAGKSLLVFTEQGNGDNVQFVRYAPLLKATGATRVTFVQPPALIPLLATAAGIDTIASSAGALQPHDYWVFPLSLPFHFGSTPDTLPATLPYLWALPERVEQWRPRLAASGPVGDIRVGLVWRGNPDHDNDANRSLPHLSVLAPLWQVPGISFVSLQKGRGEDEARQPPPGQPLLHLGDDIAGALGKPVWLLLPGFCTDWRWLLERTDSPWYPGVMRLFRQPREASSWDDTIREMATALRIWSATPPALALPVSEQTLANLPAIQSAATPAPSGSAIDGLLQEAHTAYLAGRRDEAAARLREALALDPSNASAWNNLASTLAESGFAAEAEAAYRKAVGFAPTFVEPHINFAYFLNNLGRITEAAAAFRAAIALRPDDINLHNSLGAMQLNAGDAADAESAFRAALALDPGVATIWNNLGNALKTLGRPREAEAAYREALLGQPDDNLLLNNLAVVLSESGRATEALALLRRITTLAPYYPDAWNNFGTVLQQEKHFAEAETAYRKAIAIHPGFAAAHGNLANLLATLQHLPEAEIEYRRATALDPNFISAHWNLAVLLLNQGRWAEAWPWLDRRNDPFRPLRNETFGCPEWRGEDLTGKSMLIDSVEGQGDNIMCARYVHLLKAAGASRITLLHRQSLKPLLETVRGVDAVVHEPPPAGRHDFWCFSFSLLARFDTTPANIPAPIPYVFPLEPRVSYWRRRLAPVGGFRVGLVWKGDPANDVDRHRSLPHLATLAPLWQVPGVSFVSLQKGRGEEEARLPPPGQPLVNFGDDIADFADTAAIISELDLLITVDTAAAHVAGALGKPVWVLLPDIGTDWRWLQEREDTPWYPGVMRLFRQSRQAPDWQAVIGDLTAALAASTGGKSEAVHAPAAPAAKPSAETALRPFATESSLEPSMTRPSLRPAAFVLASSDHGTLIVNRNDYADTGGGNMIGVGCQVLFNSSFDRDEVDLALRMLDFRRRLFGDGVMALDCGANIGVHTVEWAKQMHGWGSVIAVEAQERVFYALAGNITINNCFNARAIWGAVGAENGEIIVPRPDYLRPGSYGSMEIRPSVRNEFIGQPIDYSEESGVKTRLFTIDSLALPRVDFIKIDIEGMEMEALAGAMGTIRKFRPQMIIEKIKSDETALRNLLIAEGYRVAPFTGNLVAIHGSDPSHEQLLA
jgi:FkbM family methyltransferase